ncbi:ABC transporter substrate-binding protein [Paenibacillus phocaensis]|uniref:ABC transporter substrate-binding protein n=1 Tax=Paenibacillus phocaensis TaxID=1776378 RepID=UPI000839CB68|nr:ABC transporter substrate-binding protein [Paenibacillus phocaensis]
MKTLQKRLGIIVTLLSLCLVISACGKTAEKDYDIYIYNGKSQNADALAELAKKYEEETGVKVKTFTLEDNPEELRAEMNLKTPPTIFTTYTDTMAEWQQGGFLLDLNNAQSPEFKQLASEIPEDIRLTTDNQNNYGIPYGLEGYGYVVNTELIGDLFGDDVKDAVIEDLKVASYPEFEKAVLAFDNYIKNDKASEITLNGTKYTLKAEKSELAAQLTGVFAVAGSETWTYGDHMVNVALAAAFNNAVDARNATEQQLDSLKGPLEKYAQALDFKTSHAAGKTGPIERGGEFINKTVNGYDQAVQLFADSKAIFLKQGNWVYANIQKVNPQIVDTLTFIPVKLPLEQSDVTAEGKSVEKLNSSISVFVPSYYSINATVSKEEQKKAEEFLLWMNTSEIGQEYIQNKFFFIPYNASEDTKLDNSLNNAILDYKKVSNTISNPYVGAPATWARTYVGQYIMENYLNHQGAWQETDYTQIAENAINGWKQLINAKQ